MDYANLSIQFEWLGFAISLQGIRQNSLSEISSTKLTRLDTRKAISRIYHLEMTIATTNDSTNLHDVPPMINPILKQFQELFQDPHPLVRPNTHQIHLASHLSSKYSFLQISTFSKE